MASEVDTQDSALENWPKWDRKEQIKMRYSGQEYVSKSGKVIPAKKQPELICTCPQKCGDKIPQDARERLFKEFYRLSDHALQNRFLQAHIEIRAVQRRFWRQQQRTNSGRSQRRVSCKYQVPLINSASDVTFDGRTKPGIPIVEVCQKAFMNVYAITEKRVRIQRERLICQAQEFAAANGSSPLQPVDSLSLLGHRPIQPKAQARGGENIFQQKEVLSPRMPTLGNNNISITPSRLGAAPMPHPREIMSKLSDRDITMLPAHISNALSILPIKGENFEKFLLKHGVTNAKGPANRDITMIPLSKAQEPEDDQIMPTDLTMPTDLSVRKSGTPKDLSKLNIPSATTIVPVSTAASNQPVDLSVKSSRPKTYDEPEFRFNKYKFDNKYKSDKPLKQEYESDAEMDGDEADGAMDYDADMEPGMEAGTDGDMAMEQAYEPDVDSEIESRQGATPDSVSSLHLPQPVHPFLFQPNGYDIALVNSFFMNQLWQPEFIDNELLKEYHRKREELKERKKKQRQVSRVRVATETPGQEGKEEEEKVEIKSEVTEDAVERQSGGEDEVKSSAHDEHDKESLTGDKAGSERPDSADEEDPEGESMDTLKDSPDIA